MVANIEKIITMVTGTADANALSTQLLAGATAYVKGTKITGTMTDRGAINQSIAPGGSYTIPAGYHNGSGKVTATTDSTKKQVVYGLINNAGSFTCPFNPIALLVMTRSSNPSYNTLYAYAYINGISYRLLKSTSATGVTTQSGSGAAFTYTNGTVSLANPITAPGAYIAVGN